MKQLKHLLKKPRLWISLTLILAFIILYQPLQVTVYDIDADFDLKVMQISDLHDYELTEQEINKGLAHKPDIIVITGDFIDRRRYNLERSLSILDHLKDYPIFYVTGNHEAWSGHTQEIIDALEEKNVRVLRNTSVTYKGIKITGIDDPSYNHSTSIPETDILLAHRSGMIPYYTQGELDVVFTGHAHGGQFRIFGQGIFSPDQGFMPKYTSGVHQLNDSYAVISRGIGNSIFPIRLFNRPEIVIVNIRQK